MSWICKPTAGHETHGQSVVYDEETGKSIAIVYDGAADGDLIASAPELLELLKELADHASDYGAVPKSANLLWARVGSAIAKAEGN